MTVNCTHKLVLGPKKSILKFEWYPLFKACFHIMLLSKRKNCIHRQPTFQNFPWVIPPLSPRVPLAHFWFVLSLNRTTPLPCK